MKLYCVGDVGICRPVAGRSPLLDPTSGRNEKDIKILLNWELPFGDKIDQHKKMQVLASDDALDAIKDWTSPVATLANNHILDAGKEGLNLTINKLNKSGIECFGAGISPEDVEKPWFWKTDQGTLCVINWVTDETTPSPARPDDAGPNRWPGKKKAEEFISNCSVKADWILVIMHWGIEHYYYPHPLERDYASGMIEAGADVIIGHHPHVVRGMELIDDKPVFYSLGNYYFDDVPGDNGGWKVKPAPPHKLGLAVEFEFEKGSKPVWKLYSHYWDKNDLTRIDPKKRAEALCTNYSRALENPDYDDWYQGAEKKFWKWEYLFKFYLPTRTSKQLFNWLTGRLRSRR